MATLVELQAALIANGYVDGVPAGFSEGPQIDRATAQEARCEACGHVGLRYYPFHRPGSRGYVAVVACPACSWAAKF